MNPPSRVLLPIALAAVVSALPPAAHAQTASSLQPVTSFGSNPGNLLMFEYAPPGMPEGPAPLVIAMHGCEEAATDYESAGWNTLADTYKFYVVYPQQQQINPPPLDCFDWYGDVAGDIVRDQGEALSVKQMVDYMKSTYSIDSKRVFSTGFSSGAAYAIVLLALYPDVFSAGASFEGVPFMCATSEAAGWSCMSNPPSNTPAQWGALVKQGYPGYTGPYPRLSVWEGTADTLVESANQAAIVAQWTNVLGVSQTPTTTTTVNGNPHAEYADSSGTVQVETYLVNSMPHAVAIDPTHGCGTAAQYFDDVGVCAVLEVANFFGLTSTGGASSSGGSGGGSGAGSGSGGGSGSSSGPGASSGSGSLGGSGGSSGSAGSPEGGSNGASGGPADASSGGGCSVGPGGRSLATPAIALLALGMWARRRRRSRRAPRSVGAW